MQQAQPSLFARSDTMFGVCEGLGEDFGFDPIILRLAFPVLLFFQPVAALGGYAALGLLVLASRMLFPNPRVAAEAPAESASPPEAGKPEAVQEHAESHHELEALAA